MADLDRDRFRRLFGRPDQTLKSALGTPAMLGTVISTAANIAVGSFLIVQPTAALGAGVEGGSGSITVDSETVPVLLLGPHLAATGDLLVCRFVNYRWVAERASPAGGPTHTIPGCPCTAIPDQLFLHVGVAAPPGLDYVVPMILQYGPKPAALAFYNADPNGYYSTAPHTTSDGNFKVWYWFGCSAGLYFLQFLYDPTSPNGYPERGLIMSWLVGLSGNTCTPFSLTNGTSSVSLYRSQGISINGQGPA